MVIDTTARTVDRALTSFVLFNLFRGDSSQGWKNQMSRILAVDDMEFNRHHLRKVLESDGFEVDTVGDGRSAWDQLRVAALRPGRSPTCGCLT